MDLITKLTHLFGESLSVRGTLYAIGADGLIKGVSAADAAVMLRTRNFAVVASPPAPSVALPPVVSSSPRETSTLAEVKSANGAGVDSTAVRATTSATAPSIAATSGVTEAAAVVLEMPAQDTVKEERARARRERK